MAIRAPLTAAEKQYLQTRKEAGATLASIARDLSCSLETVRKWWRRLRHGVTSRPRGRPRRGILSTYPAGVAEEAVAIKRAHPHWGPANVKLELKGRLQLADDQLPSDARVAALFRAQCPDAVQPRRRQQYPNVPPPPARRPHQRWQIDGKEKVAVGDGEVATILNIRDPAAALMIGSRAIRTTTAQGWRKVTLPEVQDTLRQAFTAWGLPLEVQTDHEVVYVGSAETAFPSHFTLWLVGLGLTHLTSRDRRPTDQPQVERGHRTLGDMAWKDEHFDRVEDLQAALDDRRQRYNQELPVHAADCHGRPPLGAHPEARHSGRPFHPALEWTLFDMRRVEAYLACHVWTRQVSAAGNVGLSNHLYYVGCTYHQQTVSVRFIPETRTFRFQVADGTPVKELPAVGLDQVDLIGYMPLEEAVPVVFQLPLPLEGV
ncbi:MAG TPA: hypothetical protein VFL17_02430 [Anaerolineae bacterium]|nr:hypothetical protein [Anaerolineae bacterium]